jgi:hypothetical protein
VYRIVPSVNFFGLDTPLWRRVCGHSCTEGTTAAVSTADPSRNPEGDARAKDSALSAEDPVIKCVGEKPDAVVAEDPGSDPGDGDNPIGDDPR